jgi:RNA polymerase sigma factor (TIGR02999 family)
MSQPESGGAITQLLTRWQAGDVYVLNELAPLVYDELRRIGLYNLRKQRDSYILQPTALVHEAWLRISKKEARPVQHRAEFFALASRVMRDVLVDHVRTRTAAKRGGTQIRVELDHGLAHQETRVFEFLILNEALDRLTQIKPRYTQIIEMRFFGGLSIDEAASVLNVSTATIEREWRVARCWLRREMARSQSETTH